VRRDIKAYSQLFKGKDTRTKLRISSVFFEQTRNEYCACLQEVRDYNNWEGGISHVALAIKESCRDALRFTRTMIDLQRHMQP
jgi:hypothetical protein